MKITNNTNLPGILYRAICGREEKYSNPGILSPSSATDPVRAIILKKRHYDEIEKDASTMLWSLFGSSLHSVVEGYANDQDVVEHRMEMEIDVDGTLERFVGTLDLYETEGAILDDYKVTSAWTLVFGDRLEDWEIQENCYRHLLDCEGVPVKKMRVWALLRDWSRSKASKDPDYPQEDIAEVSIKKVDVMDYLVGKLREIRAAEKLGDNDLPLCTAKERWAQPDKWALMKTGRKSAVKLYESEEEASQELSRGKGTSIEYRPGKSNRCEKYCDAFPFCNQARKEFGQ